MNGEIFYSLREAQNLIENWRKHSNSKRPHSAMNYRPPAPEAIVQMDQDPRHDPIAQGALSCWTETHNLECALASIDVDRHQLTKDFP